MAIATRTRVTPSSGSAVTTRVTASRARARADGDALPVDWIAADRQVDAAPLVHQAPDEGDILLLHLAVRELPCELGVRPVVLGHHHQTGRATVEAVHDAGPHLAADAAEAVYMVQKRVDEGAFRVTRGGVHDHAGRLVDDSQIRVVVENFERQRLRSRHRRCGGGNVHSHHVTGADGDAGTSGGAVEPYPSLLDEPLDL